MKYCQFQCQNQLRNKFIVAEFAKDKNPNCNLYKLATLTRERIEAVRHARKWGTVRSDASNISV